MPTKLDVVANGNGKPESRQSSKAISTRGLCHSFGEGQARFRVLDDVNLLVDRGEIVVLMGPSGSGKTTLLTLLGCLRSIQEGSAVLLGEQISQATNDFRVSMRRRFGFIFQAHNLHESLTAYQNVQIGLGVHRVACGERIEDACGRVLDMVGLSDRGEYLPSKLSGGQKQRVAIARALVGNPDIVFADEPTSALDKTTGRDMVKILRSLADKRRTTVVMVTHDHRIVDIADRIISMEDGRVMET